MSFGVLQAEGEESSKPDKGIALCSDRVDALHVFGVWQSRRDVRCASVSVSGLACCSQRPL